MIEPQNDRIPEGAIIMYRNDPKFSDKQVWTNSVDPDQTAPRGSTLFAISSASLDALRYGKAIF